MFMLGKHSLLLGQSDTFIVGLLVVSAARRPASLHSYNHAFRDVDYLFSTTCSATMFAVYLLSDPTNHPQPSSWSSPSVLWVSLPGPTGCPPMPRQDGIGDKAPTLPYLLHCCCTAEPVLTRTTKHKKKEGW